jgi:hypothetical protein
MRTSRSSPTTAISSHISQAYLLAYQLLTRILKTFIPFQQRAKVIGTNIIMSISYPITYQSFLTSYIYFGNSDSRLCTTVQRDYFPCLSYLLLYYVMTYVGHLRRVIQFHVRATEGYLTSCIVLVCTAFISSESWSCSHAQYQSTIPLRSVHWHIVMQQLRFHLFLSRHSIMVP